jgi:hypothetical protein
MRMKPGALAILLALASSAFASESAQQAPLTDAQSAQIVQEARAVIKDLGDACQRLDVDAALKDALDGPGLLMVPSEGMIMDPRSLREGLRAFYAALSSMRFTTLREGSRVLAPDLVLHVWTYEVEGTSRKGVRWFIDTETASYLLRKIDGAWKFVFFQESHSPMERVPAPSS